MNRMTAADEASFRDYVSARMPTWRRTAYLMCRDWHLADDLVGTVLGRLYRRWRRRSEINDVDAYVNGMLARAVVDETRRPWRREHLVDEFPADGTVDAADAGHSGRCHRPGAAQARAPAPRSGRRRDRDRRSGRFRGRVQAGNAGHSRDDGDAHLSVAQPPPSGSLDLARSRIP
ncbi:hypothetical protein AB0J82_28475 [Asanoa sp. NPDC049518]|uniref:hypothetical protein n=1 Tax=unclassified Asanoa TaxID=2685164 RepID=UPI0034138E38